MTITNEITLKKAKRIIQEDKLAQFLFELEGIHDEKGKINYLYWLEDMDSGIANLSSEKRSAVKEFLNIQQSHNKGIINFREFTQKRQGLIRDFQEKSFRPTSSCRMAMGILAAAFFLGCAITAFLAILGFLDLSGRANEFVIFSDVKLLNIGEINHNLEVDIEAIVQENPQIPSSLFSLYEQPEMSIIKKTLKAQWIRLLEYNENLLEPRVNIVAVGERTRAAFGEYEGKRVALRPGTIQIIAEITFRNKGQQNEWLSSVDVNNFIY